MILRTGAVAALLTVCFAHEVSAQIILGPAPPGYGYGVSGWRLSYKSGPVLVTVGGYGSGFYPSYPSLYPPPYSQQTIVLPPPSRINVTNNYYGSSGPLLGPAYDQDTRGYDLDQVPIKRAQAADAGEARPKPAEDLPSKPLPGVDVSKAKAPVRPGDPGQPQVKPPVQEAGPPPELPRPPQPLPDPRDESARLIDQGMGAFQAGSYGLAAQRFRQATELMPGLSRAYFLLAQAEFALGNYRDAVDTIHSGMKIDRQWPRTAMQPRLELYKGRDADYGDHMKRLTDAVAATPNNATLLFLVGHQLWFDGQRIDALAVFQRARPLAVVLDRPYIDAFLVAGGPGKMAKA